MNMGGGVRQKAGISLRRQVRKDKTDKLKDKIFTRSHHLHYVRDPETEGSEYSSGSIQGNRKSAITVMLNPGNCLPGLLISGSLM